MKRLLGVRSYEILFTNLRYLKTMKWLVDKVLDCFSDPVLKE